MEDLLKQLVIDYHWDRVYIGGQDGWDFEEDEGRFFPANPPSLPRISAVPLSFIEDGELFDPEIGLHDRNIFAVCVRHSPVHLECTWRAFGFLSDDDLHPGVYENDGETWNLVGELDEDLDRGSDFDFSAVVEVMSDDIYRVAFNLI